jgi:hypothetical protein
VLPRWYLARLLRTLKWRRYVHPKRDFQRTTRNYIPEDNTLNNQRCENLKSYLGTKIDVAEDVSSIRLPAKGMTYSERWFSISFSHEDVGSMFLRSVGVRLQDYALSQPGRLQSVVQYKFAVDVSKLGATPVPTSHYAVTYRPRSVLVFVALVCFATSRKVAGSIADEVTGFFNWPNPSSRTIALGWSQPLTEMSTRIFRAVGA